MKPILSHNSLPVTVNSQLHSFSAWLAPLVLLLLRLTWGFQLYESGHGHLTHIPDTIDAFTKWGVPFPKINVYISGITELTGGILLMLGFATRYISIPLVFNFIVAIISASRSDIAKAFHSSFLEGWDAIINDTAFPFLMFALVMFAFGAGLISVDYLLGRKFFCESKHG